MQDTPFSNAGRNTLTAALRELAARAETALAEIAALEGSVANPDALTSPKLATDLDGALAAIQDGIGASQDVTVRRLTLSGSVRAAIVFIEDLADLTLVQQAVLARLLDGAPRLDGATSLVSALEPVLTVPSLASADTIPAMIQAVLAGNTLILVAGFRSAVAVDSQNAKQRSPGRTSVENVLRGPQVAFTEKLTYNLGLLRVRVKDPGLRITYRHVGRASGTEIALCALAGRVHPDLEGRVLSAIESVSTDTVTDSGELSQHLNRGWFHVFPLAISTERPDQAERALYDGRVLIFVQNSPFALILPSVYVDFFRTPEDYYIPWVAATALRWLRLFSDHLAVLLPGLYICIALFNPGTLTPPFMLALAASRTLVPYSPVLEVFMVSALGDILVEASIRSPKVVGSAIPIVGGIVIGDVLIKTHLAGDVALVAASLATVAQFTATDPTIQQILRIQKYWYIAWAAYLGFFGLMIAVTLQLLYMATIDSVGVPYFYPVAPFKFREALDAKFVLPPRLRPHRATRSDPRG